MILADTSVWIDHLRLSDTALTNYLGTNQIVTHEGVIGEIALGSLRQRTVVLEALDGLPKLDPALDTEVRYLIEQERLFGLGIGYIDAQLLASLLLNPGTLLWTRDKRLRKAAEQLRLSSNDP